MGKAVDLKLHLILADQTPTNIIPYNHVVIPYLTYG